MLRGQASTLEGQLRAWVLEHGPVDLGDEVHGFHARPKREVMDVRTAATVLRQYLPEGAIWDELTLGSGGIEKLVRRVVSTYRKDQRDEEREALLEELREVEAIGDTRSTEFRRKKKDEEPDE